MIRKPGLISLAITLSIFGYHYRKICRLYILQMSDSHELMGKKTQRKGNIMSIYLEDKDIEQLMAEADEIIQQINSDFIKEMEEEDRLRIEIYAQNLKKRKSEIESRIRKEKTSETGSGAQGMHEAIDDIVKAMNGLKKYFTDFDQPPLNKKPAS
jgi:hypothetical protein